MWHGASARYHAGSIACLVGLKNEAYKDELGEIRRFEAEKERWVVRMLNPSLKSKAILVAERNIVLLYSLLPQSLAPDASRGVEVVDQGSCGKGLVATRACPRGQAVLEELPFLVVSSAQGYSWRPRWDAYVRLAELAQADPAMALARRAFDELSAGPCEQPKITEAVESNAESILEGSGFRCSPEMREKAVAQTVDVLMRFQMNQFPFPNGAEKSASAVYHLTSRMNHSCDPSVSVGATDERLPPATVEANGGRIVALALRDLEPGDSLTANYGPNDLVSWPFQLRQRYLLEQRGFVCQCSRCVADGA